MFTQELPTKFAPAQRATTDALSADVARFRQNQLVIDLLAAAPGLYLILNEQRQIVFASEGVLTLPGVTSTDDVIGLRLGEALHCEHAETGPGGCGTSEFCRECGAIRAILASLGGRRDVQECRLTLTNGAALDLQVSARPLRLDGRVYSLFTVLDIASEKRRRVLERIFFHDILNTAGGMMGLVELLRDGTPEDFAEYKDTVYMLSHRLVDEIKAQQTLAAAETGELALELTRFNSLHLVYELLGAYTKHEVAQGRNLAIAPVVEAVAFISDKTLVSRVVGNMIKNALEASHTGQTVTISCRNLGDVVEFSVHNPDAMPHRVHLQIFHRSFSTKGAGRGLGTYSMKLLSEQYLHGRVGFTSSAEGGTTFFVRYPREFPTPENTLLL